MLCILLYSACPNADTQILQFRFIILLLSYACLNWWIFIIFLNFLSVAAFLMAAGNLFHSFGLDIAKDLSRKVLCLLLGILSNLFLLDIVSFSKS